MNDNEYFTHDSVEIAHRPWTEQRTTSMRTVLKTLLSCLFLIAEEHVRAEEKANAPNRLASCRSISVQFNDLWSKRQYERAAEIFVSVGSLIQKQDTSLLPESAALTLFAMQCDNDVDQAMRTIGVNGPNNELIKREFSILLEDLLKVTGRQPRLDPRSLSLVKDVLSHHRNEIRRVVIREPARGKELAGSLVGSALAGVLLSKLNDDGSDSSFTLNPCGGMIRLAMELDFSNSSYRGLLANSLNERAKAEFLLACLRSPLDVDLTRSVSDREILKELDRQKRTPKRLSPQEAKEQAKRQFDDTIGDLEQKKKPLLTDEQKKEFWSQVEKDWEDKKNAARESLLVGKTTFSREDLRQEGKRRIQEYVECGCWDKSRRREVLGFGVSEVEIAVIEKEAVVKKNEATKASGEKLATFDDMAKSISSQLLKP